MFHKIIPKLKTNKKKEGFILFITLALIALISICAFSIQNNTKNLSYQYNKLTVTNEKEIVDFLSTTITEPKTVNIGRRNYTLQPKLKVKHPMSFESEDTIQFTSNTLEVAFTTNPKDKYYYNFLTANNNTITSYHIDSRTQFVGFPIVENTLNPFSNYLEFPTGDYPQFFNSQPSTSNANNNNLTLAKHLSEYIIASPNTLNAVPDNNLLRFSIPLNYSDTVYIFKTDLTHCLPMNVGYSLTSFENAISSLPFIKITSISTENDLGEMVTHHKFTTNFASVEPFEVSVNGKVATANLQPLNINYVLSSSDETEVLVNDSLVANYPQVTNLWLTQTGVTDLFFPIGSKEHTFEVLNNTLSKVVLKYTNYTN